MDKPDYDFWAAQPLYSRINAAFLCCDLEPEDTPEGGYGPPKVAAMYARLGGHRKPLAKGDIWKIPGGKDYLMARGFLREWAEVTGQRPAMPFLFPEDWEPEAPAKRTDPKTIEPGQVTEREEPSVLKILGAALQVAYGDGILADLVAKRSERFTEVYTDIRDRMPISEDTLRKYLKRIPWEDLPRS